MTNNLLKNTVTAYQAHAAGKRALAICVLPQAIEVAEAFNSAGIKAEAVLATMPKNERDEAIDRFNAGETTILCGFCVLAEDNPDTDTVILLSQTHDRAEFEHMIKAARKNPSVTIIDMAGNTKLHPLPDWFTGKLVTVEDVTDTPVPVALITITAHDKATTDTIKLQTADTAEDISLRIIYALAICEGVPTDTLLGLARDGKLTIQNVVADYIAMRQKTEAAEAVVRFCVDMAKEGGDPWEEFRIGVVKGAAEVDEATTPTN